MSRACSWCRPTQKIKVNNLGSAYQKGEEDMESKIL